MQDVKHYVTAAGLDVFATWIDGLRDRQAVARVLVRIDRLALGNFGDCKSVGGGVSELRIDWGSGYRVYFARVGQAIVLLLCGGDKRTQQRDIEHAKAYLHDYKVCTAQAQAVAAAAETRSRRKRVP